ncbi:hypothetical protein GCM10010873_23360 [Cypionkella aquatica]|uniref:Uncharacterized protein n=1 Tax=Cypionkella aquatica TaxID=1756042 RepID=A0AA37X0N5_9RHOB|nr:hypothetical protein [Cypionkella aquatica]GLS87362.1 hypothetical protein GCM10010873_23360 [Cypionkella aquatica]
MKDHLEIQFSTIAELLFLKTPSLNFARLVADLDVVLARFHDRDRELTWDCEDLASFDMPGTRIVLATAENPRPGVAASLTLSVGPSHLPPRLNAAPKRRHPPVRHEAMCSKLVERVQARLNPDAVYWHEWAHPVTAEVIDSLAYAKPKSSQRAEPDHPVFTLLDEGNIDAIYARGFYPSNDRPHLPLPRNPELARLRAALYPPEPIVLPHLDSTQMRLAAHTMNATLMMVALPVGAAMLTYSVLRGENMRLTSAALVGTGVASSLMHGPMAGILF